MSPSAIPSFVSATVPRTASARVGFGTSTITACNANTLAYTVMYSATSSDSLILLYLITTFILPLCAPSIRNYITTCGDTNPVPLRPTKSRPKAKGDDRSFGSTTAR